MTWSTMLLILVSLLSFVAGQILFKTAASDDEPAAAREVEVAPRRRRGLVFALGIVFMTVSFFVNLSLLQHLDLSFLFPFQGLSVLIVVVGACVFLRERLSVALLIGTLLITAGVMLVSTS